jgi:hypothetical protein
MTLIIAVLTPTGVVLSSDSRQTYRNQAGVLRVGSDSVMKIFKLTPRSGIAISGRAFINEDGKQGREVGYFIRQFVKTPALEKLSVKESAEQLNAFLTKIFVPRELALLKKQIEDEAVKNNWRNLNFGPFDGTIIPYTYLDATGQTVSWTRWIDTIEMLVAGIDQDGVGRAYSVKVGKGIVADRDTVTSSALWLGQTDVLMRIVKGYAPEIDHLQFVKDAVAANAQAVVDQVKNLEYIINWGTITLQDAVDFCVLMTKTTESIQRFSDGTPVTPGGIPGVGGAVDVAVMTPEKGFIWLQKKKLRTDACAIELDSE